jgi:hypothetical protein
MFFGSFVVGKTLADKEYMDSIFVVCPNGERTTKFSHRLAFHEPRNPAIESLHFAVLVLLHISLYFAVLKLNILIIC